MAELSAALEQRYVSPDEERLWAGSPFRWIRSRPSRQVGAIGEELVASWCESKGFNVERSHDSDCDRLIEGLRIEIKFSTLWTKSPIYKFQQIRDQQYDYCFCLGIAPFDVHAWLIPKEVLAEDKPPHLVPQHGGNRGRDTKWLSFPAAHPPGWINQYGGQLDRVESLLLAASQDR